jgi:hypothetical protein
VTSAAVLDDPHNMLSRYYEEPSRAMLKRDGCVGDMLGWPLAVHGQLDLTAYPYRSVILIQRSKLSAYIQRGPRVLLTLGPCSHCDALQKDILDTLLHLDDPLITHLVMDRHMVYEHAYAYLHKRTQWMCYQSYRRQHLPIGSGITEAACKIVFTQRLKRSGVSWTREGGQVIVDLRVIWLSGVWKTVHQRYLASKALPVTATNMAKGAQPAQHAAWTLGMERSHPATEVCQVRSENAYDGHLVLRLIGSFILFYTSRVICKGRLTMEEIIFHMKHYWRFVDLVALELQALS